MGLSENVVYPVVPNGFADHYPVFKWLFQREYTPFSDKPILHSYVTNYQRVNQQTVPLNPIKSPLDNWEYKYTPFSDIPRCFPRRVALGRSEQPRGHSPRLRCQARRRRRRPRFFQNGGVWRVAEAMKNGDFMEVKGLFPARNGDNIMLSWDLIVI